MTHELEKLQRKGTKPTCPHCHATVLSTSQPERVGATAELRDALILARDFIDFELPVSGELIVSEIDAALAATPAVGGETIVNCVRFVKWALQEGPWSGGDLDGGGIQDKAESLGLIVSVPYDPEKHGAYNDYGCDAGDPWFEFLPGLNSAATPAVGGEEARYWEFRKVVEELVFDPIRRGGRTEAEIVSQLRIMSDEHYAAPPASPLRGRELLPGEAEAEADAWIASLPDASPPEQPAAQDLDNTTLMPPRTET